MDEQLVKFTRRWSTAIGLSIQYAITNLFSRLLPLVSGGLFGIGVYSFWMDETAAVILSATMAIFTAGGVEAVGFMASHRAIKAYEEKRPLMLPLSFVAIYLIVGGGALWFTDAATAHKIITTAVFLLVAVNYALIGMESIERKETAVERKAAARVDTLADSEIEFERELKRQQMADRLAVKMAKITQPIAQPITQSATKAQPITQSATDNAMIERACLLYTAHEDGRDLTPATARQALAGVSGRTVSNVIRYSLGNGHIEKKAHGVYTVNGNDPRITL